MRHHHKDRLEGSPYKNSKKCRFLYRYPPGDAFWGVPLAWVTFPPKIRGGVNHTGPLWVARNAPRGKMVPRGKNPKKIPKIRIYYTRGWVFIVPYKLAQPNTHTHTLAVIVNVNKLYNVHVLLHCTNGTEIDNRDRKRESARDFLWLKIPGTVHK